MEMKNKGVVKIETINQIKEDEIRERILEVVREILNIGVCKNLTGYFLDALVFGCKMEQTKVKIIEEKVLRYFKQQMDEKLLYIFEILRENGYDVVDCEKFISSIERMVTK